MRSPRENLRLVAADVRRWPSFMRIASTVSKEKRLRESNVETTGHSSQ